MPPHGRTRRLSLIRAVLCITLALALVAMPSVHAAEGDSPAAYTTDPLPGVPAPAAPVPDFVPTDEWQRVMPGQHLPRGLWVRMDMESGEKWARNMPLEEMNEPTRRMVERERGMQIVAPTPSEECDPSTDAECTAGSQSAGPTIRQAQLPVPGSEPEPLLASPASEAALRAARAERLRLLKEHFYLKEDVEAMKQLIAVALDPAATVPAVVQAMEQLEEYLHQVDNAADWSKIGGLDVALAFLQEDGRSSGGGGAQAGEEAAQAQGRAAPSQDNNTTATAAPLPAPMDLQLLRLYQLQSSACWLIGTAAQNHPFVQAAVEREGGIETLVRTWQRVREDGRRMEAEGALAAAGEEGSSGAVTLHQLQSARLRLLAKLLYALSSLLRSNASMQTRFLAAGGLDVLSDGAGVTDVWRSCADSPSSASPSACLSPAELASLRRLGDTLLAKQAGLLHSLVVDHTVNTPEGPAAQDSASAQPPSASHPGGSAAAGASSSPALFAALTRGDWCRRYVQIARRPAAAGMQGADVPAAEYAAHLTPTQLSAREAAVGVLQSLLTHRHPHAATSEAEATAPPPCLAELFAFRGWADEALAEIEAQHRQVGERAARAEQAAGADEDAEGQARYHAEMREQVTELRRIISTNA